MFTILNRLRGTWSWFAKVAGITIGLIFFIFTNDLYTSIALSISYVAGESMGWGKWIGGVFNEYRLPALPSMIEDEEGRRNGIHYLASLIYAETENYYRYCYTALTIRGMYWASIALLPVLVMGYIGLMDFILSTVILGFSFPSSVKLGEYTADKFRFKFMEGYWEHAEVWYGLIMDLVILYLIL